MPIISKAIVEDDKFSAIREKLFEISRAQDSATYHGEFSNDVVLLIEKKTREIFEMIQDTSEPVQRIDQKENEMDKNQLAVTTFRLVKEAMMDSVNNGYYDYDDDRLSAEAKKYAARIVDMFIEKKVDGDTAQFVDQYYEMDPKTEDLLDNGSCLIDGMKVLIENPSLRQSVCEDMSAATTSVARITNRWTTIENVKIIGSSVSFIGIYEDGVKRKRRHNIQSAWLVKKDSIPRIDFLMSSAGVLLDEMPTAKMVAYLKDTMKVAPSWNSLDYKIQTGIGGDVVSLSKYLIENDETTEPVGEV